MLLIGNTASIGEHNMKDEDYDELLAQYKKELAVIQGFENRVRENALIAVIELMEKMKADIVALG